MKCGGDDQVKPVHIVLLVVAGALGGAVLTSKVWQKQPVPAPKQVAAAQPAPAAPVQPVTPEEPKPSPVPLAVSAATPKEEPRQKPAPAKRVAPPPANPRPIETARVEPMPAPKTVHAPVAAPAPEPVSLPPARPEPEPVTAAPPPPPPPAPNQVTLNAGVLLPVRLIDGLNSERNLAGDTFTATLDKELVIDGFVIAERGARVDGRVSNVDRGGKVRGVAAMWIELTRIRTSDGQTVAIQTETFERRAEASHQTDAAKVGAGAAVGAIIGAIAGGGKGAAIGAGVGGGAGAADVALTRGKPVTFPSETRISFRLRTPVTITERR
jgi:hypothetical protein